MDVLSDVLRTVRMSGAFFFHIEAHAPWGSVCPTIPDVAHRVMPEHEVVVAFHVVTSGSCWTLITEDPASAIEVAAGDVIIFSRGDEHIFSSSPEFRKKADPTIYDPPLGRRRTLQYVINGDSGAPETARYVCGYFGFDAGLFNLLLDALPRMFRARATQDWLSKLALAGVGESERGSVGGEVMLARLADLMFVDVIRQHLDTLPEQSRGWLAGLRDRHVGAALGFMHERPADDWTLERLARQVGLSRSVFAERFNGLVGMPAAQYLARWRLTLAARLLEDPDLSFAEAGEQVGYHSEAAFQRAFKKHVGTPPGAWRKARATPRARAAVLGPA